jgi:hypothetical protein
MGLDGVVGGAVFMSVLLPRGESCPEIHEERMKERPEELGHFARQMLLEFNLSTED